MNNRILNNGEVFLDFQDVLIYPTHSDFSSRKNIDLTVDFGNNWKPVPIMSANMDTITGVDMAFELLKKNWIPILHKYVSIKDISKLYDDIEKYNMFIDDKVGDNSHLKIDTRNLFISRGATESDKSKLKERIEQEPRIKSICIDVANGYANDVLEYVKSIRNDLCKDKILMVGNIATGPGAEMYANIGVDIIKAGIGQGSACLTRVQTGVGVPQIGMNLEIEQSLSLYNRRLEENRENRELKPFLNKTYFCSDGGCKVMGDISKAFVSGADFVMIGGMLSGTKESPGKTEEIDGRMVKRFSGMAAKESQHGGVPSYGVEEGKTVQIPYKGKVAHIIEDIEGGIRSSATYINAQNPSEFKLNGRFIITHIQENKVFSK